MSADRRPEWLPEEWTMRVSIRASGSIDRYYTSLASGYTCRSKVEVMRYLNNEKNVGSLTRSTPCFRDNKKQTIARVEKSPEWLPSGWIMEIKTRESGAYAGKPYKCYINPFIGYRFYSKREVFRYLNSEILHSHTSNERRRIKNNSMNNIHTSSNQNESISKKFTDNPPIAARKRILRGSTARRCLFSGQANMKMVIEIEEFPEKSDLPLHSHLSAKYMGGASSICMAPSNDELLGKIIETLPDPSSCGGVLYPQPVTPVSEKPPLDDTRLNPSKGKELGTVNEEPPAMEEQENVLLLQPGDEKLLIQMDEPSEEWQLEMMNQDPTRSAYTKPHRRRAKKRRGAKKRGSSGLSGSHKQASGVRPGPKRTRAFKAITLPLRSSKRLAGIKADHVPPPVISGLGSVQSGGSRQTSTKSFDLRSAHVIDLELLDNLENQESSVEQATPDEPGARQLGDGRPESPLMLPFGFSWPDPCIEFAFKTLTGDIPVLEDTSVAQGYLDPQLISAPSGSTSFTYGGPKNLRQPELHVQLPLRDGSTLSFEKGLQSGIKVNKDCRG